MCYANTRSIHQYETDARVPLNPLPVAASLRGDAQYPLHLPMRTPSFKMHAPARRRSARALGVHQHKTPSSATRSPEATPERSASHTAPSGATAPRRAVPPSQKSTPHERLRSSFRCAQRRSSHRPPLRCASTSSTSTAVRYPASTTRRTTPPRRLAAAARVVRRVHLAPVLSNGAHLVYPRAHLC